MKAGRIMVRIKEFSTYLKKAQKIKSGYTDGRQYFVLLGQACHFLAIDFLKMKGWKIMPHVLTGGSHQIGKINPIKFIKKYYKGELSKEIIEFFKRRHVLGILSGVRSDLLIAKENEFALVEIKSTSRETNTFYFSSTSEKQYYDEASKIGISIKFIFVKISDKKLKEIVMCNYPEDLSILITRTKIRVKLKHEKRK